MRNAEYTYVLRWGMRTSFGAKRVGTHGYNSLSGSFERDIASIKSLHIDRSL